MNPRVSRSSALASKASGYPIARVSAKIAVGMNLDEIRLAITPACFEPTLDYVVTKMPRFPFDKFPTASNFLSTQMKATGEVLGIAPSFHEAMMKGLVAAGYQFKTPGPGSCVIISVKDSDKAEAAELAWKLHDYGYKIYGTPGTARFLNSEMVPCSVVRQMSGARPNVIDLLESGLVDYIISTSPHGRDRLGDSVKCRR